MSNMRDVRDNPSDGQTGPGRDQPQEVRVKTQFFWLRLCDIVKCPGCGAATPVTEWRILPGDDVKHDVGTCHFRMSMYDTVEVIRAS